MKIIDIQLGRKTSYGGTAARRAEPWQATVYSIAHEDGSRYPDEKTIPPEIAEKMAVAAVAALMDSGFFEPSFSPDVVPLPAAEPKPEPEVLPRSAKEAEAMLANEDHPF